MCMNTVVYKDQEMSLDAWSWSYRQIVCLEPNWTSEGAIHCLTISPAPLPLCFKVTEKH